MVRPGRPRLPTGLHFGRAGRRRRFDRKAGNLAALLALIGLVIAGVGTYGLIRNPIPLAARAEPTVGGDPSGAPAVDAQVTVAPPNIVITDPKSAVPGSLVYVKSGNLFVQTGAAITQITQSKDGSQASQPAWSPDGQWIYYIETRITTSHWYNPDNNGFVTDYTLTYPVLVRVHPDGSEPQSVLSSLLGSGSMRTFYWIRQPALSPDGKTVAVISDGPTYPTVSDTLLRFLDLPTGKFLKTPELPSTSPFGHADPAYSPDGSLVAYVREDRTGHDAAPSIYLYDVSHRTAKLLADGYRGPTWSPDGKCLAVTRVNGSRLDVMIIDASTGTQVGQITSDGQSWAPVWSPAGGELVYMHLTGSAVGLVMIHVTESEGRFSFRVESNLAEYSGLDGGSRAAWYVPPAENQPAGSPS